MRTDETMMVLGKNTKENKIKGGNYVKKVAHYLYTKRYAYMWFFIVCSLFAFQNPHLEKVTKGTIPSSICKAETKGNNDKKADTFDTAIEWIANWVVKLGAVVAFVGLIEIGYGFFNDNPQAKTRGWQIIIGGGIIAAAGLSYNTFI